MLSEFGPSLYVADGPSVSFYGFPYPTRMAVARLSDGSAWVWSPIALTDALAGQVEDIGPVRHIVSPNKIHHLFMGEWAERWPDARMYASPGLTKRRPDLRFTDELRDAPDPAWADDIDQVVFHGSIAMEEVVFFHKASSTAIVCDLIQRHAEEEMTGWKGKLMRLDGLVGERGSTPREWRASFLRRRFARAARAKLLSWEPERLVIAHGECAQTGATGIIADALRWI
ncbi:MAG: DUF4336 domain-containing protein [Gammaproteobacteria bacterium]|nr:DUF4336 domain-containing protein [Gammaproteobacteria bacterium]MBT8443594.1 DUF4336 domain-containing protein [Gammaproteobacteria bacterium]NND36215.1 DUF4336 domain-containing protein [Gammaproteobacteria bacterium]